MFATHPYARVEPDSNEGRAYSATVALMRKAAVCVKQTVDAGNKAHAGIFLKGLANMTSRDDLIAAQALAAQFNNEAQHCTHMMENFKPLYEQELIDHGVSPKLREELLRNFSDEMRGYDHELLDFMKLHNLLASHIESILAVLIGEWGRWKVDPANNAVVFTDQQAMDSFRTIRLLIEDSFAKIKAKVAPQKPAVA